MAGEAGDEVVPAQEAAEIENDDDFNAGYGGDKEPTATPAPTPEPTDQPTPAPTEAPKYVQITEQDWQSLTARAAKIDEIGATLDKKLDTAFGKIGGIERFVKDLQTQTPAGEAVKVDEDAFKELVDEYPELGKLTANAFNKAIAKFRGTGGADPAAIEKIVAPRVQEATEKVIGETLNLVLPKWKEHVKTPDFSAWFKTQPPQVQALANSDGFDDSAQMLSLYRQHLVAKSAPPTAPAAAASATSAATSAAVAAASAKAATTPSSRQRQIAAAVPPRGDGGHPPAATEDDQFEAGFKYQYRSR